MSLIHPTSLTRRRAAILGIGLALVVVSFWIYSPRQVVALRERGLHSNDFKHLWIGSRLVRQGESPYDEALLFEMAQSNDLGGINPYVYLPFTGLVLTPIADLPFERAAHTWFEINHFLLWLALALVAFHATGRQVWWAPWLIALGIGVAAMMMPLMRQLTAGQLNCALALLLVVILISMERGWNWMAGLAIAFATLFKLSPGIFVLYLLWKRAWWPLAWTIGWLTGFMIWSLWQVGFGTHLEFLPLLADMRVGHSTWAHHGMAFHSDVANQAMGAFLLHIFAGAADVDPWWNIGDRTANAMTTLFALGLLGGVIFLTRRGWGKRGPTPEEWRADWSLLVLASLLIPSLCWDHYVVQLLPVALVGIWATVISDRLAGPQRALALVLWALSLTLLTVPINHWSESLRTGLGPILISLRLWGMLLILGLVVWWRVRIPPPERPSLIAQKHQTRRNW